ncbi:MAG: lytic transglycosylase domain-containing protein [Rhodoferax sp.]|nr:lytic transglycosylase domain-containing protein [Rhodoferax sp.]
MRSLLRRSLARSWVQLLCLLPCFALADEAVDNVPAPLVQHSAQAADGSNAAQPSTVPWYQHIQQAARAYGVDAHLLQAVVQVESNFDPSVVSRSGAIGLMQIMPATAAGFIGLQGTRASLARQLQDPAINVHAGALYLRSLMDSFSSRLDLALAAYNAGAGNVRKAGNRVPPNGQTPLFVKKVTALYASIKAAALAAEAAPVAPEAPAYSPLQPVFAPQ